MEEDEQLITDVLKFLNEKKPARVGTKTEVKKIPVKSNEPTLNPQGYPYLPFYSPFFPI